MENDESDWDMPPAERDAWICQSCGYRFKRRWPKEYKAGKCPSCKSEDAMPHGWSAP